MALPFTSGIQITNTYNTGKLLYFGFNDNSGYNLYCTDGTAAGTVVIYNGQTGNITDLTLSSSTSSYYNGYFYFETLERNTDTSYGRIYKTDGTVNGTTKVFSTLLGIDGGGVSTLGSMIAFNSKLYFLYNPYAYTSDPINTGDEIYEYDGVNPPKITCDLSPGQNSSQVSQWVNVNDKYLVISGVFGGVNKVMRLMPNEACPVTIANTLNQNTSLFYAGGIDTYEPDANKPIILNGKLFFTANITSNNASTYVTNGDSTGTFHINLDETSTKTQYLGASTAGVILGYSPTYNDRNKVYIWSGADSTSFKVLSDSLTSNNWAPSIRAVVQINEKLLCIDAGPGNETNIYLTDTAGSYCFVVSKNLDLAGSGALVNNSYIALAQPTIDFSAGDEPHIFSPTSWTIWTGAKSSDWNDAGNWQPALVPTAASTAIISSAKQYPVVTSLANCKNLALINPNVYNTTTGYASSMSNVTINKPGSLGISGYLLNYGYVAGTGSLAITGTGKTQVATYDCSFSYYAGYPNVPIEAFNIDTININGADWDLTNVDFNYPNTLDIKSIINFQTDNKLITNFTGLSLGRKPYFTGFNSNRFILTNRNMPINLNSGIGSASTKDSVLTIPVGTKLTSYTPLTFVYPYDYDTAYSQVGVQLFDTVKTENTAGTIVSSGAVNKVWYVNSNLLSFKPKLQFTWGEGDQLAGFNHNSFIVSGFGSSAWVAATAAQAALYSNNLYSGILQSTTANINSYYTIANSLTALPILLQNFTVSLQKNDAILNWQTLADVNTAYFNIQRSVDGINFTTVGVVMAAGNNTTTNLYDYTDANVTTLNANKLYYRLQANDKNGAVSYSKVIALDITSNAIWSYKVLPNPVHNVLQIQCNNIQGNTDITLMSIDGKKLVSLQKSLGGNDLMQIDVSAYTAGIYIIQIKNGGESKPQKFMKD